MILISDDYFENFDQKQSSDIKIINTVQFIFHVDYSAKIRFELFGAILEKQRNFRPDPEGSVSYDIAELEAQHARILVLEEELQLAKREKLYEEESKNEALHEVQVFFTRSRVRLRSLFYEPESVFFSQK